VSPRESFPPCLPANVAICRENREKVETAGIEPAQHSPRPATPFNEKRRRGCHRPAHDNEGTGMDDWGWQHLQPWQYLQAIAPEEVIDAIASRRPPMIGIGGSW
jgi:hypothetical protein